MNKNLQRNYTAVYGLTGLTVLLTGIGLGRFGYPALIPSIVHQAWFSVAQADYLGAANLTGYIGGSVVATLLNRYIGSVTLIRLMLLLTVFTFISCAFPLSFPVYFLLRLICGTAGGVVMVLTAPTLFKHVPKEKRGLIGGFIFSGVGIGIALAGTVIPLLVNKGLSVTWFVFGAVALILMIATWKGWPEGSNEKHASPKGTNAVRERIWNKTIVLLIVSYACNAVGFVPHTVFWVDFISRGLGMGLRTGTVFWVILGLSAAIGPLLTGFLADRIGFAKSIRISLLVKALGVILPLLSTSILSLCLSSICVGSLALGISSLAAGRTAELVGTEHRKKVWSYMTITYSVSHAMTAFLLTYLLSFYGSYYLLFIIGAIALVAGSAADYWSSKSVLSLDEKMFR
jgi:predicted MFS family arabinose efflux permease